MAIIEFDLNQSVMPLQAKLEEPFKDVVKRYLIKSEIKPDTAYFLVNGNCNPEGTVKSLMGLDKTSNNTLKVIVKLLEEPNKEQKLIKSKDIICPECYESCKLSIENGKFNLYGCSKNHKTNNIKMEDFKKTQMINMYNIICGYHKDKNMGNSYQNKFFKCLTCNTNLCLLCQQKHAASNHKIVNYEQKNYICPKHGGPFIKYCKKCNLNLCINCEEEHENHDAKYFSNISLKKGELKRCLIELKEQINEFNKDMNKIIDIIEKLKSLSKTMDLFYEINSELIANYDMLNTNYFILGNIKKMANSNNELFKELRDKHDLIKKFFLNMNQSNTSKNHFKDEIDKNNQLANEYNKLKNENKTLKNKIDDLNYTINKYNQMTIKLKNDCDIMRDQLSKLSKDACTSFNETCDVNWKEVLAVNFISHDQRISNYSIVCKKTDLFVELEEKLYNEYPEFKDYLTYCLAHGQPILRFKTLEENNIRNNDKIIVFCDFEEIRSKNRIFPNNSVEKLLTVNFVSMDGHIMNYSIACKNTDPFFKLEEKLYNDFPEFKEIETSCLCNGERILRFKTLEENGIKAHDIIQIITLE